jgi:glyoxylase-like metal-dependent hydrolase (beta-lactamase superfamily II)
MASIEQIRVGFDNFSYVIWCPVTRKAAIVDPGYDASKTIQFIASKNLVLNYVINTHFHRDHSGDNKRIKDLYPLVKIVISKAAETSIGMKGDVTISDGDQLKLGEINLDFILTPGHTPDGLSIVVDDEVLVTGDTLFIGDCGRTDLPGGDLGQMFITLNEKIKTLPDHLIVYPGHDYGDKPFDTLGHQKQTNKTLLARSIMELSKIP